MIGKRKSPDTETVIESHFDTSKLLKLQVSPPNTTYHLPNKIRVPPSTIPGLSKETCKIIEDLKSASDPQKSTIKSAASIVCSVPASERYRGLFDNTRSLPLSNEYQTLIRLFRNLDATISYAHMKHKSTLFCSIQTSVEQTYSQNCKIQQIQKILTIYPQAYALSWTLLNKDYSLVIDFPEKDIGNDRISLRKSLFHDKIIDFTRLQHKKFLENRRITWELEDSWHPDFDLNQLEAINPAEIPDKPAIPTPSMDKFLFQQFENNKKMKEISEEIIEVPEVSEIKGLSPTIAAKIMAKDRFLRNKRLELVDSLTVIEHNKGERLIKMVEIIKVLFSTHKTPSMFWNILVDKLKHLIGCPNHRIIEEDLQEVINNCPGLISLIQTNSGPVVRVNKQNELKLADLKQEMKKKYNLT